MAQPLERSDRRPLIEAGGSQGRLLEFLLNPCSYPHHPKQVRLIQTHSAFVFIVPPLVYKVKKAVNFGFLDFSTLAKRRAACERELVLNRRLCNGVYLEVVPISRQARQLILGAGGQVIDYAIRMRYLSQSHMLDQLVRQGRVGARDIQRIAVTLARFYSNQHPSAEVESWGRPARLRVSTNENFAQTREFVGRTLSAMGYRTVRAFTGRFYQSGGLLLAKRVKERRIRDCHGDLHLEHIHLTPQALHIYDCIEFNDRFRYVDIANDIAFLAMDLDHEGRPDLARVLVHRLIRELRDPHLSRLLPFYKCYRAYVRGKVESLHSVADSAPPEERTASAQRAAGYFRLALAYAIGATEPMVLVVMGRIGSGKSSVAQALGDELGWPVFSSDALRKGLAGFPLHGRSDDQARKVLYAQGMTRRTYQALLKSALHSVRQGQSVILDATFARRSQRDWLRGALAAKGLPLRFVELVATDREVKRRLQRRERYPMEVSDARLEDFTTLSGLYQPASELPSHLVVRVASHGTVERVTSSALSRLARLTADLPVEAA
jgi:aminoglycoside phosphotransferase family enzyme/predicted kinase